MKESTDEQMYLLMGHIVLFSNALLLSMLNVLIKANWNELIWTFTVHHKRVFQKIIGFSL